MSPIHADNLHSDSITSALPSSADSFEIEVIHVPLPSSTSNSEAIVESGFNKSQKWLIESFSGSG
jgi:hypothetical protein